MPVKPAAKKPAAVPAKKPAVVPAKQESEEEDEDEENDEEDDEEDGIRCLIIKHFKGSWGRGVTLWIVGVMQRVPSWF